MKSLLISLTLLLGVSSVHAGILEDTKLMSCRAETAELPGEELMLVQARCQTAANLRQIDRRSAYEWRSMEHRAEAFQWQLRYTIITLVFVGVLVAAGVGLTLLEFLSGRRGASKLSVGAHGIEVDSKFVGIIVLVISLAFAYLFLEKAYPVEEVGAASARAEEAKEAEDEAEDPDAVEAGDSSANVSTDANPQAS